MLLATLGLTSPQLTVTVLVVEVAFTVTVSAGRVVSWVVGLVCPEP